jgi:uncharacterized phage protein (TIGR02218 family)
MLDLPQPLADHLASGSTSLCRCWRLIRRDGATMGFTDHDSDLVFNGVTFQAASGFEASEAEARLGLSVGGAEVAGALSSAAISEADIAAGRYDGASLETWLVNWADVSQRALLDLSSIGEIRREDGAFAAELRSAAAIYDEEKGRLFTRACDAAFGDVRCGAPLSGTNRIATTITGAAANDRLTIATIPGLPAGWFSLGRIEFTSGAATGFVADIATHGTNSAGEELALSRRVEAGFAIGDAVVLIAGCDKSFATCRDRFANALNFRGFPHIPSADQALGYAERGRGKHDGGSLFR